MWVQLDELEAAPRLLTSGRQRFPKAGSILRHLAVVYALMGELEQAIDFFGNTRTRHPRDACGSMVCWASSTVSSPRG